MLEFIFALEKLLKIWPDNVKWTLFQISEQTHMQLPHVVEFITEGLNKSIDVHEPLSYNEVNKAFNNLRDMRRTDIEKYRQREAEASQKAVKLFHTAMEKIRLMQTAKNWRSAYLTLNYFYGLHKERLPDHIMIAISNEAIRSGIKASINFQELSTWLTRGIRTLLKVPSSENIEDALDFLDAYGDHFLNEPTGKGEQFITNIFLTLKPTAMEFDLMNRLNNVAGELRLHTVKDVVA